MGLFFQENKSKKATGPQIPVDTLRRESCKVCPLDKAALHNPKMKASGSKRPEGYVLGEAPGEEEDKLGKQFVGKAGKKLRQYLPEDIVWRYNNTIQCRPPGNRDPMPSETECCRNRIVADIEKAQPEFIVTTGNVPTSWILGESAPIFQWRGKRFPAKIGEHVCWVYPVYHPSYVLRRQISWGVSDEERIFERDLMRVDEDFESLPNPRIIEFDEDQVVCLLGKNESDYRYLDRALQRMEAHGKPVGVDVETYPLRPYNKDSMLVSVAIADHETCVSFPVERPDGWSSQLQAKVKKRLKSFMLGRNIKVCHNQDMESTWLASRFGTKMFEKVRWADTMALAYVLDNRRGTLSLDFQCLQWLGARVKNKYNLDMRNMHKMPLDQVLPYNGLDSLACLTLYKILRREVRKVDGLWEVYRTQIARARVYSHSVYNGVPVHESTLRRYQRKIERQIEEAKQEIQDTRDAKKFRRTFGRTFRPGNEKDETDLFVTMLRRPEVYVERKGGVTKTSFDQQVLQKIDRPVTRAMLDLRRSQKLLTTYVTPIYPAIAFDGMLHAQVNDKFTATSRTSYEDPNLQNFPRRRNVWIRGYVREQGGYFLGFDYGQIEARVIAMLSGDERFVHALWNHLDIHMDWTEIFLERLPFMWERWSKRVESDEDTKVKKGLRDAIKNKWVFPSFFGASVKSRARYMDITEEEAKPLDRDFWDDFSGVKAWQEEQKKEYQSQGFLILPTGRRVHGPLTFNEICNYPVQGTASEIQKDAMVRIYRRFGLAQVFEIHDDLTYLVDGVDADYWRPIIAEEMCVCPFDFINVPLTVECKEGKTWAAMEETVTFESTEFGHER